jgi:hypothetical protein
MLIAKIPSEMASITEAYSAPNADAERHERLENPQFYDEFADAVRHVKERRHVLGLVGGKEIGTIAGNQVDLESDLLGITRPNSDASYRHHLPPTSSKIQRNNPKIQLKIDATPVPLPAFQQWAYPSVMAPEPLRKESCSRPEKY